MLVSSDGRLSTLSGLSRYATAVIHLYPFPPVGRKLFCCRAPCRPSRLLTTTTNKPLNR